jgi:hypothetical protein
MSKKNKEEEIKKFLEILPNFVKENSKLTIDIKNYYERPDVRETAINFEGNLEAYLSLREILNYCSIEFIEAKLDIAMLSFVNSLVQKDFFIEFCDNQEQDYEVKLESSSGFVSETENSIIWKISWTESAQIIQLIHGFSYNAWNHLHFDPEDAKSKFSVMFYLSDQEP